MRTILFLALSATLLLAGCSTMKDPAVKAAREAEQAILADQALEAIIAGKFVLEADRVTFKSGRHVYVSSFTNFIMTNDGKATIQMAFNSPYAGPNGMGGITVDGSVSNVKMKTDKKGNINYTMSVMGVGVSATVNFTMTAGTNKCTAIVTPNFNSRIITFSGYVYPKDQSNVFKGRAL